MSQLSNSLTVNEKEELYKQIIEHSFEPTIIHSGKIILYLNKAAEDFLDAHRNELIGNSALAFFKEDKKKEISDRIERVHNKQQAPGRFEEFLIKPDGSLVEVELTCAPVEFGDKRAIQTVFRDITQYKLTESQLSEVRHEIYEIATAIVPVSDGVSIIPLGGRIDSVRVDQLLDTIPLKLKDSDLDYLIIDFSGIYKLDEVVVGFLFNINDIIRLLGIHPVFTGIRPELARKAVQIGKDLTEMHTVGTVKQAIQKINKT
ncbi:PAS domain S-box protein [Halobacillus sp. A1]|uniref:PAS domain S-box protein n=1 Tax=Halobacillus sp. A1 TaxID=2880262 RepID=UPI0020A6A09A|nr:PAS domain S-box protein [Halobacillus sp. A1]MCP3031899.1 PAS domain S-box protein [Halobacillus sp. A1]